MCTDDLYWLHDIMHRKNVLEFFIKFARFEYALKINGYYILKKNSTIIDKTNFDKFALNHKYKKLPKRLKDFLTYLDNDPVGKLKKDGTYKKAKETGSDIKKILGYLRRIRNNLFHGVKYPNLTNYDDNSRGTRLINDGIIAIDYLSELDESVKISYRG